MRFLSIIFFVFCLSNSTHLLGQGATIQVDTLGITQVASNPDEFLLPITVSNFDTILGLQFRLDIDGGATIVSFTWGPVFQASTNNSNISAGGRRITAIAEVDLLGPGLPVPDGTIVGYLRIRHDLRMSPIDLNWSFLELIPFPLTGAGAVVTGQDLDDYTYSPATLVSGTVRSPAGTPVAGVTVELTTPNGTVAVITDASGAYSIAGADHSGGGSLRVVGYLTPPPRVVRLNGVNVADATLVKRHVEGIALLSVPDALLAADVDRSGTIDVADLEQLQSYIVARTDSYLNAGYYVYISGPGREEVVNYSSAIPLNVVHDFTAVKLGDVNFSAQ